MKESYPDDIMLCFVQSFNARSDNVNKTRHYEKNEEFENNSHHVKLSQRKVQTNRVPVIAEAEDGNLYDVELRPKTTQFVFRKNLSLISGDRVVQNLPEVKRSFSDRFSVIGDIGGKKSSKGFLTIRKTRLVYCLINFYYVI